MKLLREVFSWIGHIAAAFTVALFINIFIFQPTLVEGQSMEPTLQDSDKVLLNKISTALHQEPDYGDIVVIDSRVDRPRSIKDRFTDAIERNLITVLLTKKEQDEVFWIKRVIGKPGDVLEFQNGNVSRNGVALEESYIKEKMNSLSIEKIVVPEGSVFVMGDNRNHSMDSRRIGCVPLDHVIGKFIFKF